MNTFLSFLYLAASFAVDIVLEKKPNLTANCYRKAAVSLSFTQNRFLKLPQYPVCSSYGFEPLTVLVPYSIDTFVWEVSGFFTPDKMGSYAFSIPMAKNASIEIKQTKLQQQGTEQTFHEEYESILHHTETFGSCSVSLRFIDRRHYYIKIVYIAGPTRVPIYVTDPAGIQQDLDSMIEKAVYDPRVCSKTFPSKPSQNVITPSFYQQVGFFSMVFFLPKELKNHDNVLRDYKNLEKVDEGYFQKIDSSIKLQSRSIPYIREILGHFRAPLDGKYRVALSGTGVAAVQIGPRKLVKDAFYVVTDEWNLLDTRSICTVEVELEKAFFYPFRIVSLNDEEKYRLDISVLNYEGKSIDLFGIWKDHIKVNTLKNGKYELFAHAVAPCNCFCRTPERIVANAMSSQITREKSTTMTLSSSLVSVESRRDNSEHASLHRTKKNETARTAYHRSQISTSICFKA